MFDVDEPIQLVTYLAFVVTGILSAIAQGRFFRALRRRESGVAAPDDDVLVQIGEAPLRFLSIVAGATRLRLSALPHRWPYREVERLRRRALGCIAVSLAVSPGWSSDRPSRHPRW
jgi:hypothetical protein